MVVLLGNASPPSILPRDQFRGGGGNGSVSCSSLCLQDSNKPYGMKRRSATVKAAVFWRKEMPTEVEMESINNIEQLDEILRQLQEEHRSIVIEWMAEWCRKCKYLKPKLENLAGEFHPKVKFYSVDVNKVSQALIKRGNISKMPTIQLWKDGEMKAEIIGGHKAWLVIEEVREMIQTYI